MTKEIKYTNNGKKVIIVGKLNFQESIVQEIFVSENGAEIPSGENFVVKSLHDEPVLSWEEHNLKKIKKDYNRQKENYYDLKTKLKYEYEKVSATFKQKINWIKKANELIKPKHFDLLTDYITGNIEYVIEESCYIKIFSFKEFQEVDQDRWCHDLKLLSFFGNDDGTFSYKINKYKDGSGCWQTIVPCKNKKHLKDELQKIFAKPKDYNQNIIDIAKEYNIKLNPEKIKKLKTKQKEQKSKEIKNLKKKIKEQEKELKYLEKN